MGYWESNGHVTDDVTWPWKVKVVTPICLGPSISETAGDSDLVTMERLYVGRPNGLWRVEWSCARRRHASSLLIGNWLHIVTKLLESTKLLENIEKQHLGKFQVAKIILATGHPCHSMFGLSGSVDRMALKNANLLEELAAPHTLQLVGGACCPSQFRCFLYHIDNAHITDYLLRYTNTKYTVSGKNGPINKML